MEDTVEEEAKSISKSNYSSNTSYRTLQRRFVESWSRPPLFPTSRVYSWLSTSLRWRLHWYRL